MEYLPTDVLRVILRFIPRNNTAQIIYDSRYLLSLKYVRKFMYQGNTLYEQRIWNELTPVHLKSIFYGDTKKITRTEISKGQYINLKRLKII
tara:strand:+ start:3881 stop:4156 length:276 start_codon:yes stop_codon:yes gene_type:complete